MSDFGGCTVRHYDTSLKKIVTTTTTSNSVGTYYAKGFMWIMSKVLHPSTVEQLVFLGRFYTNSEVDTGVETPLGVK